MACLQFAAELAALGRNDVCGDAVTQGRLLAMQSIPAKVNLTIEEALQNHIRHLLDNALDRMAALMVRPDCVARIGNSQDLGPAAPILRASRWPGR